MKYYEHDGHMKYDYLVSPGADYQQIKLEYKGATSLSIDKGGNLLIETPLGTLYEPVPLVTQNGKQLEANWQIKGDVVSFEIKDYDPTQVMIIDPLVRVWGTYYGGIWDELIYSVSSDLDGNIIISGSTVSPNNIATSGVYQTSNNGSWDIMLGKFNINGAQLWGTYIGGSQNDFGYEALSNNNKVFLAGQTNSVNLSTNGSVLTGLSDGLIGVFNSGNGQRILSTYFGGEGSDGINDLAIDRLTDDVVVVGATNSLNGVSTNGTVGFGFAGGDGFVAKINSNTGNMIWGTYYAESFMQDNLFGVDIYVDKIYCVGVSFDISTTFTFDIVVLSVDLLTGDLLNVQHLRGNHDEFASDVKIDSSAVSSGGEIKVVITGISGASDTGISTIGAYQEVYQGSTASGQSGDAFIAQYSEDLILKWATYYGGSGSEELWVNCEVDVNGNIWVCGSTSSDSLIATPDAYQNSLGGFSTWTYGGDAFIVEFDSLGNRLYATYYGGDNGEYGNDITLYGNSIYLVGSSLSTSNISTPSCHQENLTTINGNPDGFIVKFVLPCLASKPSLSTSDTLICEDNLLFCLTPATSYLWSNGATTQNINLNQSGEYFVTIVDSLGCISVSDTISVTVLTAPIVSISGNLTLEYGSSTQIIASGGEIYSWQPPGLSCIDCPNPIVQPEVPTQYTVTVTDSNGCVNTKTVFVNIKTDGCIYIPNIFSPNKDAQNDEFCLYGSCLKSGTFTIYNRWGEKVFETTDMKQCWDGTYKGEPVNADVFVYKLSGVLVTGEVVEETGDVQVAR